MASTPLKERERVSEQIPTRGGKLAHIPREPIEDLVALCGYRGTVLVFEEHALGHPNCIVCAELARNLHG